MHERLGFSGNVGYVTYFPLPYILSTTLSSLLFCVCLMPALPYLKFLDFYLNNPKIYLFIHLFNSVELESDVGP